MHFWEVVSTLILLSPTPSQSLTFLSIPIFFLFCDHKNLSVFSFINLLKNPINELIYQTINNDY